MANSSVQELITATSLLDELERLAAVVARWDAPYRATATAYRDATDALNVEALRRLITALQEDPVALLSVKRALKDDVVYAVLRQHGLVKPSLHERIEAALESVRPMLASHGGDVQLVRVVPPSAIDVRFTGACESCPASVTTFTLGVKTALASACPEITEIREVKGPSAVAAATDVRVLTPFVDEDDGRWYAAGRVHDIPDGGVRFTTLHGEPVILARSGEGVTAFQNACAHLGLPLDGADVADGIIVCPEHGFAYEIATGACRTAPGLRLRAHAVRVTDGDVRIRIEA